LRLNQTKLVATEFKSLESTIMLWFYFDLNPIKSKKETFGDASVGRSLNQSLQYNFILSR